ncbi:PAX3- and PAX7-binding protein 1 [Anthonomus grandis grandis]|uniref:PAX3- and PAX7-binding protein 1 n=1 Tax=Anthonomus grandis grandis TaxID=2921223 RepID=UPI0021650082|nr:PAX3- and PAX7-binding protein 1 [Anthonomus grandis grandis]
MSLFRKPKKNIVQRRVFTENDEEDEEERVEVQEIVKEQRAKKKEKNSKSKQKLLSFEVEEEGEVFQVRKSSHQKRVMRMFEKEKRKKDKDKEKSCPKEDQNKVTLDEDTILVVRQNHKKPPTPPPPPILSGRDALCAGKGDLSSEEDNNEEQNHRFSRPENVKKVLESGAIPDASMIHFARKKRQKAREMGDYISVEDEEPEDTGRLVRDDDNEESDEERIEMDPNMVVKRDMEKRREQFLLAQESDKELDEWEDQQIRKGVTGPISLPPPTLNTVEPHQNSKLSAPLSLPPDLPRTPQAIADQLREHYREICASKESHITNLQQIELDLDRARTEAETLKKVAPEVATRFRFYQELRGYITDLVEFMDDKINDITALEGRALKLMQAKATFLMERRRQDVRDEMGGEAQADEEKVRRAAEREGRRSRRRRARETLEGNTVKHVEGLSSDEEMGVQDQLFFDKEQNDVEQDIFKEEEMFSISNILTRFDQWKTKDLSAYNEAYASLCLPKIIAPLIRLNLIFWNPLQSEIPLDKMDWYRPVALYSLSTEETESSLIKDPDVTLLPTLIEKILVPKLATLVDKCWDPLSSSQTLRLVGTVKKLVRKFPTLTPESKSLTTLFSSIQHRIKQALDSDVFIPITLKMADSRHQQFFQRQFASGLKLLKNIASWQGILNEKRLKELALTSLLNKYLLSALKFCNLTDACSKMRLISQVLPIVWLQEASVEFQMFKTSIGTLQRQLDKNNPLHLESIDILMTLMKTLRQ